MTSLLQPCEELGDEVFGLLLDIVLWEPLRHYVGDLKILIIWYWYWAWFDMDSDRQGWYCFSLLRTWCGWPASNGWQPPASLAGPEIISRLHCTQFMSKTLKKCSDSIASNKYKDYIRICYKRPFLTAVTLMMVMSITRISFTLAFFKNSFLPKKLFSYPMQTSGLRGIS